MNFIEEIQDNAITKLRFTSEDEYAIDNVRLLIDAIKKNSSIVAVEFLDDFMGCVRNDSRSELLQALVQIPCLQELCVEDGLIQIADIAKVLCGLPGLKALTLRKIVLQGIEEDFNACEMALHQHCSLKEFVLEGCQPAVPGISIDTLELAGKKQASGALAGSIQTSSPSPASARTA